MARHTPDSIRMLVTAPEPPGSTGTVGLSVEELTACLSASSATVLIAGRDLRVVGYAGPRAAHEFVGQTLLDLIPGEHRAFYAQQVRRALTGGETITFEALSRASAAPQRWERVRLSPLAVGGDIRGVIVRTLDIEHERAIARRADRLRATFDYVDEGMLVVDLSTGNVIECNEAATRLLQVPADELNDTAPSWLMLEPSGMPRLGWGALLDELCEGRPLRGRAVLRDGQEVSMELRASAKRLDDGHFAFVFCRDIRDELAQERVRATQERLATVGSLAAGVAHEVNNPLAYVIANVQFALELLGQHGQPAAEFRDVEAAQLREALLEANEGARRVQRIVADLKTLARQGDDRLEPIDVAHTLRWAIGVSMSEIKHRARLTQHLTDLPPVRGDEARLGQVFVNILLNAAQAIEPGRAAHNEIAVHAFARGDRVVVAVTDTGPGIAEENLTRIFDPFFTTKPRGVGTGLGLSICHEIVASMHGTLSAANHPDGGAMFTLELPALTQVHGSLVHPTRRPPPTARPSRRARVLVIDDETLAAKALARMLREHEVTVADHAPKGLALALEGDFDVVFCDLMMPELSGMALFREIELLRPELAARVLFITGGTFTDEARNFAGRHAARCLFKPFDAALVREHLATVLGADPASASSAC